MTDKKECFSHWDECKFVEQQEHDTGDMYTIMKILCPIHHECYLAYREEEKRLIREILDRRKEVSIILS